MLKDNDIRVTLIDELNRINAQHDYRIIEELAVCDGEARVDVAVANGRLCGYEIKSDADTLERLALQQKCYDKTFDMVSIVVGEKFKDRIEEHVPNYWGIYIVSEFHGKCKIKRKRTAKINKNIFVRTRQPGDTFRPAGRHVGKTLKKYLNEAKVPVAERTLMPLLACGSQVLWLWGAGFADGLSPDDGTKQILLIRQSRQPAAPEQEQDHNIGGTDHA